MRLGKSSNRISSDIGCLDTEEMPAALISTKGFHCKVWQSAMVVAHNSHKKMLDFVVKKYRNPCPFQEIAIFNKDYRLLKTTLGDMIPYTVYVATMVDGMESVIALSETVYPWFNLANPATEEEAIPLLKKLPKARDELTQFVAAANQWYAQDSKVIDLYGLDNLVLDRNRDIRFIDSFSVFFHEDLLYMVDEVDDMLEERIKISLKRKSYLEYLLEEINGSQ
jgi:hypothetical protein